MSLCLGEYGIPSRDASPSHTSLQPLGPWALPQCGDSSILWTWPLRPKKCIYLPMRGMSESHSPSYWEKIEGMCIIWRVSIIATSWSLQSCSWKGFIFLKPLKFLTSSVKVKHHFRRQFYHYIRLRCLEGFLKPLTLGPNDCCQLGNPLHRHAWKHVI